jgi:predicted PurR-regulated permease PerM
MVALIATVMIGIVLVGMILGGFSLYLQLWQRSRLLEQQLQTHQQRMEQTFTEIHNGPLQLLAFVMREVQMHDVQQQDLLQHLHHIYKEVRSGVQNLQEH